MPRKFPVPTLRRHAATNQARVLIRGRHLYLGQYGSPEAEEKYRRIVAEYLASGGVTTPSAEDIQPESLTIDALVLAYWRHAERYYCKNGQPTSELSTLKEPLRVLRRLYGSTLAAEFGPLKLKAVREELLRDSDHELKKLYRTRFPTYWNRFDDADPIWQPRYYGVNIWSRRKIEEKLDYMHLNPVRAGLVERAVEYRWSSAAWYLAGRSVGLPIRWPPGLETDDDFAV